MPSERYFELLAEIKEFEAERSKDGMPWFGDESKNVKQLSIIVEIVGDMIEMLEELSSDS